MSPNTLTETKHLLDRVADILVSQKELEKARGEKFNVFSILNLERRENRTHSAFIAELLDPKGSHNMGALFLRKFGDIVKFPKNFNIDSTTVYVEYYLGRISEDKTTGGRIDIYLRDQNGVSIAIENKIDAVDQHNQIERYVNHNKGKNTVYYLTLFGDEPSDRSKGGLKGDNNYNCLSYSEIIIHWLEKCQKEAITHPILRESIRQYIILVKRLTGQLLDSHMENKIEQLIATHYEGARAITGAIDGAERKAAGVLLKAIEKELLDNSKGDWKVEIVNCSSEQWSYLDFKNKNNTHFSIRLQGYKLIHKTDSYFGIFTENDHLDDKLKAFCDHEINNLNGWESEKYWPLWQYLDSMKFSDTEKRAGMFKEEVRNNIASKVAKQILELKKQTELKAKGLFLSNN